MDDSPAADPSQPFPSDSHAALAQLAARVAELEQQVAALNAAVRPRTDLRPAQRSTLGTRPETRPAPSIIPAESLALGETLTTAITPAAPHKSLEDRLGSQVFNLIGIVALIFGSAWALKLAIEHGLVGPVARVLIGLAAGAGLILWSELFRRRQLAAFSYTLKAVGTGILYLSLWAAFQLYGLLSAPVALALMILVTAWNAFMAFAQDAELLAAYALIGGLLTPLLLSTGGDHETFLFTYIAVIDLAVVALVRAKPWPRLLLPAFLATIAYFIGYYVRFFHPAYPRTADWDAQSTETALFTLIFFALFALVSTRFWTPEAQPTTAAPTAPLKHQRDILIPVLLPLANAAFLSLALYSVFQDSGLHTSLAWLMVALAALFLGLMRLQQTTLAAAMHLACAVVFLTIAIPLKTTGHTLTTAWLAEGLVLFWASTRFKLTNVSKNAGAPEPALSSSKGLASETWDTTASEPASEPSTQPASRVLAILSAGGYLLGLASVFFHWTWYFATLDQLPFFNADLGSALVAVVVLAGAAWLSRPASPTANPAILIAALSAIDGVALLLTLRAFTANHHPFGLPPQPAFANPNFATALIGLALLAATTWTAWRSFQDEPARFHLLLPTAACDLTLFNLVAIFLVEGEIGALFTNAEANLQRSLAVSAFLMLYAGILLAAGFWLRNAFVRWQALILILFTIAKVFLYDISGLSAGYRVASFLALGALLLTVSYAYQKDWLNLKSPANAAEASNGENA